MNYPIENDQCCGILGRWLGHKFQTYVTESEFHHNIENARGMSVSDLKDIAFALSKKKMKIMCKRCGKEKYGVAEAKEI